MPNALSHEREQSCVEPDNFVCHCECHKDPHIAHCGPCCEMSVCGLRIDIHCMEAHIHGCNACKERTETAKTKSQK